MADEAKQKQKWAFRREASRRIKALSRGDRTVKSKAACEALLAVPEMRGARAILLYCPLPDELDIWPALHAFAESETRVILPRCHPEKHEVICIEVGDFKNELILGKFNILEPKSDDEVGLAELDAVITPLRAFDPQGNRVGRGAGYYDRFFVKDGFHAFKCGIGYNCQLFPAVPTESHDVPVDGIVTESGLIRPEPGGRAGVQNQPGGDGGDAQPGE
jgi:5-formyltetrahydrofolate cyclo-ligase